MFCNYCTISEFIVEKLCAVANSLADHAVEQLRSQDNVTVMVILITDPSCQRVTNGLIETIPDSYWLTHDVKMIGKEVAEESDVDVALLTRRRNSCDPGYMRLHMSNGSGDNSTQNSRSGSRGGNENRRQSDVGLIQRLNSMSEIKKPEEPIVRRNSVFSKPKAAKVDDEKVTELKIPGSEKPPLPNSSKKKAKDEDIEKDKDDLMDFLLDDTNF